MTLGFYYHIEFFVDKGRIMVPDYLGLFVDELAKNTTKLICFGFTTDTQLYEQNYCLAEKNIVFVNLRRKPNFPALLFWGGQILKKYKSEASSCDRILVRAPSPLAPHFFNVYHKYTKISYLMVGDYLEGIKYQTNPYLKQKLINLFTYIYEWQQNKAIRKSQCIVNSPLLATKYIRLNSEIREVKTTTLKDEDFYYREDTCNGVIIKLIFLGRIEKAKGIEDLYQAFIRLQKKGYKLQLNIVGWETTEMLHYKQMFEKGLFGDDIIFHGFKTGIALKQLFIQSDIYVLPSYHEGFPRSIWEAMANGLPVIASKVGAIPLYLEDKKNALLFNAGKVEELSKLIIYTIDNNFRKNIIKNGYVLAKNITLEKQTKILVDYLKE